MSTLSEGWNTIIEAFKGKPFYSDSEAQAERFKDSTQIAKEVDLETPYITYNPFSSYVSSSVDNGINAKMHYSDMVRKWREIAQLPEVDTAISEITGEAIVFDEKDEVISLNLDDIEVSEAIKTKMRESFSKILYLLDFSEMAEDLFKMWYVDASLTLEVVYNNRKPKEGIQKLVLLPPYNVFKFKNENTAEIKWFLNNQPTYNILQDLENAEKTYIDEQITQINSGVYSSDRRNYISRLQKAIKAINQLYLLEDSLVIMRITRSPEKRAFYIDTGNLPKSKAEEYVRNLITKYRQKKIYNTETGTIENSAKSISVLEDFWFPVNSCLSLKDTKIKLLDGRDLSLENIIEEFNQGKQLWTYSCSPEGVVVPGKISWAGATRKNTQVLKVVLDNDEEVICTPDHKFFMRDGREVEAQYLKPQDSVMPIYMDSRNVNAKSQNTMVKGFEYTTVKNNKTGKYEFVHRMVSDCVHGNRKKTEVVHHIDMDRFNNSPENLQVMDKIEHIKMHSQMGVNSWKHSDYDAHCKNLSEAGLAFYQTPEGEARRLEMSAERKNDPKFSEYLTKGRAVAAKNRENLKTTDPEKYRLKYCSNIPSHKPNFSSEAISYVEDLIKQKYHKKISVKEICSLLNEDSAFVEILKTNNPRYTFGEKTIRKMFKSLGFDSFQDYMLTNYSDYYYGNSNEKIRPLSKVTINDRKYKENYNHKVKEVIWLEEKADTGTLRIDDLHEYHNYHNFALSSGIFVMNSGKGTKVEQLPGAQTTFTSFEDIDYFINKVYTSLEVPSNRRMKEARITMNNTVDVEKDEMKFFKFIQKLRRRFNNLFVDLLKKDLIAQQVMSFEDWKKIQEKIKFIYANSNEISLIKKTQILQMKMDAANSALSLLDSKAISVPWLQKTILEFTDEEIAEIANQNMGTENGGDGVDALGNMSGGGSGGKGADVPGYEEVGNGVNPPSENDTDDTSEEPKEEPETKATGSRFKQRDF